MDPEAEERLIQPEALSEKESSELLSEIREELRRVPPTSGNSVILTTLEVRSRLRKEIRRTFPRLPVVSYNELSPDMNIKPLARISPEIRPYDESFYRFINALPVADSQPEVHQERLNRTGSNSHTQDKYLPDFLGKNSALILSTVRELIRGEHPHECSEGALDDLLTRFLDGYMDLLIAGQKDKLTRLFQDLTQAFTLKETKISHAFEVPLLISTVIRRLIVDDRKGADVDSEKAIRSLHEVLVQTDGAAHRAASLLVPIGLKTKFGRLLQ